MKSMKVICAWCGKVMAKGSLPASHGICPKCAAKLQAEMDSEDKAL